MWYALLGSDFFMVLLFVVKYASLPPQIPLFYSKASGEEQLADLWMIIVLPVLMNILYLTNSFIYKKYFSGNLFVGQIIKYLNVFIITTITIIFTRIIVLVS